MKYYNKKKFNYNIPHNILLKCVWYSYCTSPSVFITRVWLVRLGQKVDKI